jgi:hypothetical protein
MSQTTTTVEPDWDTPLVLALTPASISHALFASADAVHTGWDSCIDRTLVVEDITAVEERSGNHCRLVKQEYLEDDAPDVTWHDWTVEIKLGDTYIVGHWRLQDTLGPAAWEWYALEAENAFSHACVLIGKRARRGLVIEEAPDAVPPPRTHH